MDPALAVVIVLVCVAMSAFFSGSETALMRVRSHELDDDVKQARGPAAVAVRDLIASTSRLLITLLLGNNVTNILASAVAAALAVHYLGDQNGILVATVVMTLVVFIFAEVLPKAIAARHPRGISLLVGLPIYLLHWLLRPLHALVDRGIEPLVQRLAGHPEGQPTSVEDVLRLARRAGNGNGDTTPLSIIGMAAGAARMTVSEIMVPRTEIIAFPADTPPSDLLEKVLGERYTRVLIYENNIDQVLGVVHLKDLIQLVRRGGDDLQSIHKPVVRVPERKPILRLLGDMQRAFVHVAVVKDEFGVTEGLVTQEDILEEIVGEIRDEFDQEELSTIRGFPDGSYQALGRIKVLDFNRATDWNVPAERGDTLSGLVFNELGRAPRKGDTVHVPGYAFSVADTSGTRITQVHVRRLEQESESDETAG